MKEMEIDWVSLRREATRKIVLCGDRNDCEYWLHGLSGTLARDNTYISRARGNRTELLVLDKALNLLFLVEFISTNQWSWYEKMRGTRYDEVLITRRGMQRMQYPEQLAETLSRRERNGTVLEMSLYYLTQNDSQAVKKLGLETAQSTALDNGDDVGTMSEEFDFPVSLFRRSMMGYFEDYRRPTREEFLFALTMENISGSTAREKKAIEEALLYVQSKGNNANSSSA